MLRDATFLDRFTARRNAQQLRAARPAVAAPVARPSSVPIVAAAAFSPAPAARIAAAVATAVAAERDRIRGILEAPEAKGREQSAAAMAYGGGFTVAQARSLLATFRKDEEVDVDAAVAQIMRYAREPGATAVRVAGAVAR